MASLKQVKFIGPRVEEMVLHQGQIKQAKQQDKFYVSGYMDCGRQQAYKILGYEAETEFNPLYYYRAMLGDFIHSTLQGWLTDVGKVKMLKTIHPVLGESETPAVEIRLSEETLSPAKWEEYQRYNLGGRIDGILDTPGGAVVLEIKTVGAKYFTPGYKPYYLEKLAHFEAQLQIYLHFLEIPKGVITVVNTEAFLEAMLGARKLTEACFDEWTIDYNPLLVTGELERLQRLQEVISTKELPAPEPDRGPCKFCEFRKLCPAIQKQAA
jgi:CRISPR/Cas system-associated exonuclease Cas4 (RecB family)